MSSETCEGCGATLVVNGFCGYCRRYREEPRAPNAPRPPRGGTAVRRAPPPPVPVAPGGRPVRMAELQRRHAQFIVVDGMVQENP